MDNNWNIPLCRLDYRLFLYVLDCGCHFHGSLAETRWEREEREYQQAAEAAGGEE